MARRVLLTGAAGFVGSHVLEHLLSTTDDEIVCPVTFTHRGVPDRIRQVLYENWERSDFSRRVEIIHTDLAAPISAQTDRAFGRIDVVLNVASESHVDRSISDPAPFIVNNVSLMCHLLDWARRRKHERGWMGHEWPEIECIVQVSTDEVYGPAPGEMLHREWVDLHLPSNPYSASKAAQEDIAFAYWRTYDLPIVITNTMNIIGQRQHPEKFVPRVIAALAYGESKFPLTIHGDADGTPGSRFYLHARNQADGLLYVADWAQRVVGATHLGESLRYSDGGTRPFRFNIVGEREIDNVEMLRMIAESMGKCLDDVNYEITDFHSARPGHDLRYALDGEKMNAIGWNPLVPLDESLRTTVQWTLDHPEWLIE